MSLIKFYGLKVIFFIFIVCIWLSFSLRLLIFDFRFFILVFRNWYCFWRFDISFFFFLIVDFSCRFFSFNLWIFFDVDDRDCFIFFMVSRILLISLDSFIIRFYRVCRTFFCLVYFFFFSFIFVLSLLFFDVKVFNFFLRLYIFLFWSLIDVSFDWFKIVFFNDFFFIFNFWSFVWKFIWVFFSK